MGALKEIAAGGIVAGAGVALRVIGDIIFSTFGATEGPVVDYRVLIDLGSLGIIGLGGLIAVVGVVHGAVTLWRRRGRQDEDEDARPARTPRSDSRPPPSRRDRPRNR